MSERRVSTEWEGYLGPVAVAVFVDTGWLKGWPLTWTDNGRRAQRNGYGRWDGTRQLLPREVDVHGRSGLAWRGRYLVGGQTDD